LTVRPFLFPFCSSVFVSSGLFWALNIFGQHHRCDDCAIPVGKPFPYEISSNGWGSPSKFLLVGAMADALLFLCIAALLFSAFSLVSRRKPRVS
jgi:hypothetical protein